MPTLYLIDSANIMFRAFHAIPPLKNSRGMPTNAVFGFANMLLKVVRERAPDAVAAVWDAPAKTFRDELYAEYKANRSEMPDELGPQFPRVKEMLDGFRIKCLEIPGYEADDIIATLTKQARAAGWSVVIVSGDKDLMQLVGEGVGLLDTMKEKLYDRAGVVEKWGVPPEKLGDVLALMGDAVDNVPGVPGVGEKTAVKLIQQYGSLNNLLSATASIKGKLREKLEQNVDMARLSRKLVALHEDCDVRVGVEDLRTQEPDRSVLGKFFEFMEFRRLAADFDTAERRQEAVAVGAKVVGSLDHLKAAIAEAKGGPWAVEPVAFGTDPLVEDPAGFVIGAQAADALLFVPLHTADAQLDPAGVAQALHALAAGGVRPISSDSKALYAFLLRHGQAELPVVEDLGVMSYVFNPSLTHDVDQCVLRHLERRLPLWEEICGKGKAALGLADCAAAEVARIACTRARSMLECFAELEARLVAEHMVPLYEGIERPLVPVLARLEHVGVRVDKDHLAALSADLGERLAKIEAEIYAAAGGPFNIQSPKQLNEIFFEKLQYPTKGIKKTKTGQLSTDSDVLEKLALEFPLPQLILQFRQLAKLKGTYVDALPPLVRADGRIHSKFNQLVAVTGRLSSQDPNLQNIPIREEEGKKIREAFLPAPGNVFMSCDYSQIELRILAHIADDAILQDSFAKGEDVHRRTAAEVFGVPPAQVDGAMRRKAKAVNFGIAYGQTSYGLAAALGIGGTEAQAVIDRYFERYQGVHKYLQAMPELARKQGFVATLFGRRRLLPDIHASNQQVRQFAERTAINTPIQGTAADIIKVAMIKIDAALRGGSYGSRMILQVHDELIFDVVPAEQDRVRDLVVREMENVLPLKVKLVVDVGVGRNWAEAHG
jgi:DNA polymerase-1